eukprot:g7050.t1
MSCAFVDDAGVSTIRLSVSPLSTCAFVRGSTNVIDSKSRWSREKNAFCGKRWLQWTGCTRNRNAGCKSQNIAKKRKTEPRRADKYVKYERSKLTTIRPSTL